MALTKRNGNEICISFALLEKVHGQAKVNAAAISQILGCSKDMASYFMSRARKTVAAEADDCANGGDPNSTNTPPKKKGGRPKKATNATDGDDDVEEAVASTTQRGQGNKRKRGGGGSSGTEDGVGKGRGKGKGKKQMKRAENVGGEVEEGDVVITIKPEPADETAESTDEGEVAV